jgi:hypothetical protein
MINIAFWFQLRLAPTTTTTATTFLLQLCLAPMIHIAVFLLHPLILQRSCCIHLLDVEEGGLDVEEVTRK